MDEPIKYDMNYNFRTSIGFRDQLNAVARRHHLKTSDWVRQTLRRAVEAEQELQLQESQP